MFQPPKPPPTPILWLSCGLVAGQVLAPWTLGWAAPAAMVSAGLTVWLRRPTSDAARMLALAAIAAAVGHRQLDAQLNPNLPAHHVAQSGVDHAVLRGRIADRPSRRTSGLRFVLQVESARPRSSWEPASGRVLLTVRNTERDWKRGDRLEARVRLRTPRNFGNPGEFDYEHHLARRRIYTTAYAFSDRDWRRLQRLDSPSWTDVVRWHANATLDQVAPPHIRPIAAALLLGDGASIPPETRRRYARAGVSHVLAISGLHVGLVAAGAYASIRWLLARSEHLLLFCNVPKLATAASLPPLFAYAAIAGGGSATLRATVMGALILCGLLLDRQRHWPTTLACAAAAVSAGAPGAVFEASFQLSFAAVVAIIAGGTRWRDAYERWAERRLLRMVAPRAEPLLRWFALTQAVTLLALTATAPLTLYHFQQLSLVGAISNLVVVPIIGMGAVAVGLTAVVLNPVLPGVGGILFSICCTVLAAGDAVTTGFAELPGADLHLPVPSVGEIATYYALLALPLLQPGRGRALAAAITVGVAALQLASWSVERFTSDELRITFLSVGQGDSTLIELPRGKTMLVDGGGLSPTFDVGERVIAPYLLRRKIRKIDIVVLTHPDFDHYGGLGHIVERFGVDEIWTNGSRGRGERYDRLRDKLAQLPIAQIGVARGYRRTVEAVELVALHPEQVGPDRSNDASLTLRLLFGTFSILLTGDLEREGELTLMRSKDSLQSTVLKVPHHGSKTSSTAAFLRSVQPTLAVVSIGHANRYRQPHPDVVERYRRQAIKLLRTDIDGAIQVRVAPSGSMQVTRGRRWRRSATITKPSHFATDDARVPKQKCFRLTGCEMAT